MFVLCNTTAWFIELGWLKGDTRNLKECLFLLNIGVKRKRTKYNTEK